MQRYERNHYLTMSDPGHCQLLDTVCKLTINPEEHREQRQQVQVAACGQMERPDAADGTAQHQGRGVCVCV